jgi:hypothetical protein
MDLSIKDLTKGNKRFEIHKDLPKVPFNMTMSGQSASGKTNTILNILKFYKKVFKGNIFCFSESYNADFEKNKKVNTFYDTQIEPCQENGFATGCRLEKILEHQKKVRESGKKPEHLLLIFDDFITSNIMNKRRGTMTKLYAMARHYCISVITTSQNYILIPKQIRELSQYIVAFKIYGTKELKSFVEECHRDLPEDIFEELVQRTTDPKYSFIYIDNAKGKMMSCFKKVIHQK